MSAPLIHTQVDRRDGDDVWFRFSLSQLPDAPGNSTSAWPATSTPAR